MWYGSNCECGGVFDWWKKITIGNAQQEVCGCKNCKRLVTREGGFRPGMQFVAETLIKNP